MVNAVALAGGGARGAFEVGVWKALRELNFEFSIVTGVSVGALNAGIMAMGDYETAVNVWENISTEMILDIDNYCKDAPVYKTINNLLRSAMKKGKISYKGLEQILQKYLCEDRIRSSDVDMGLITVKFPDFKPVMLYKKDIEEGKLIDYMLASASFYPIMASYKIGNETYIDGGYYNNIPIDMAIERGADRVVAVNLDAVGVYRKIKNKNAEIIQIRSHWSLGHIILFDKAVARTNIRLGYLETMKVFGKLDGYWYTFAKDDFKRYADAHSDQIDLFSDTFGLNTTGAKGAAEYLGKLSLIRALKKRGVGDERRLDQIVMAGCDITAEIYKLDPTLIYTVEEINAKLLAEKEKHLKERSNKSASIRSLLNGGTDIKKVIKNLKPVSIVSAAINIMDENKNNLSRLWALASVFPKETIAVLYLYFISNTNYNVQKTES